MSDEHFAGERSETSPEVVDDVVNDLEVDDEVDIAELFVERPPSDREQGQFTLHPTPDDRNQRLDKFIASQLATLSRSYIQQLIDEGQVKVDGYQRQQTFKMTPGQVVTIDVPPPVNDTLEPEEIPLNIVYESEDLLVINKPAGMVVHPAPGHARGTLANAVLFYVPEVVMAGSHRPGIVHRLDKDTSGLIVVAKTERGRLSLVSQWAAHTVEKQYRALVHEQVGDEEATIAVPIGRDPVQRNRMAVLDRGRSAVSRIRVAEQFSDATALDVMIETGRTHQIRVHLAYIGHPVIGDGVYNRFRGRTGGASPIAPRQMLHAAFLAFDTPDGERLELHAPIPDDMNRAAEALRRAPKGR